MTRCASFHGGAPQGYPGETPRKYTEEQVLKAIYESGLNRDVPGVLYTSYKDGIDIDAPKQVLMRFVSKLTEKA